MNLHTKILLPVLLVCALARAHAAPTIERSFIQTEGYVNSPSPSTFDVRLDFDNPGGQAINALYIGETLPAGWTFNQIIANTSGTAAADLLTGIDNTKFECLWLTPPTSTNFHIIYRVNVPANSSGAKNFSGVMDWALFETEAAINTVTVTGEASTLPDNQVRTPVITPASGTRFSESLDITITCATPGATIRYTLDGTAPASATSGMLYTSPFTITQACTVRARAFLSGKMDSEAASATYDQAVDTHVSPMVGVRVDSVLATFPHVPGGVYSLVKISGTLPAGLKIALVQDSSGWNVVLSGTPTAVGKVPVQVVYEVRLKVGNTTTTVSTIELNFEPVAAFPELAKGTYNGWVYVPDGPDMGLGKISMAVSAKGALSGKITLNGVNRSFKAPGFNVESAGVLSATVDVKTGSKPWNTLFLKLDLATGRVFDAGLSAHPLAEVCVYRNIWNDPGMPDRFISDFAGYYTAQIPSEDALGGFNYPAETAPRGTGYLTLTLGKKGASRWSGKLADGRSLSGSGVLLYDPDADAYYLPVIASYNSKKAGFGAVVEIKRGATKFGNTLVSHDAVWRNTDFKSVFTNPLEVDLCSPPALGFGFQNSVRVAGGFYNKTANVAAYYQDKKLLLDNEPVDRLFQGVLPALDGLNPPFELAGHSSGGLVFSMKNDLVKTGGGYNYTTAENPLGLTFKFTKTTGLFAGKFNLYYDYDTKHVKKAVSYRGALTPLRDPADMPTLPEAGGYFLLNLAEKCPYLDVKGNQKSYTFGKWSYGFWINLE